MDELDVLRQARPAPAPSPSVVAAHRAALRRVIGSSVEPSSDGVYAPVVPGRDERSRRRRGWWAAAAAVLVAGVIAGVATVGGEAGDTPLAAGPAPTSPPTQPPAPAGRCGALPFELPALDGYSALAAGPGGDGRLAPEPGQLVVHRVSATGSVEVRWPAGAGSPVVRDSEGDGGTAGGMSWSVWPQPQPTPSGRHAVGFEVHDPALSDDPACQAMRFEVADADPDQARAAGSRLFAALSEPGRPFAGPEIDLVVSSTTADAPPDIPACDAPAGVEHVDRVAEDVVMGPSPTAEEALAAFIGTKRIPDEDPFGFPTTRSSIVDRGYVETRLPDGSIVFVAQVEQGVTAVRAERDAAGWTVIRFDATGC